MRNDTITTYYCNGVLVNPEHSYRIQNKFEGSEDKFWYNITSEMMLVNRQFGRELNSHCQSKSSAPVYSGATIIEHIKLIREYKSALLIQA